MIKIDHIEVFNFEGAVRAMRNPLNSWEKSDSEWKFTSYTSEYVIGEADLALMRKLVKAGSDHRKFLRQILVRMDITAPLYWWKAFDTYKVGTVANSCSTMHTIHKRDLTLEDFSHEMLIDDKSGEVLGLEYLEFIIGGINKHRRRYMETNDKREWYQIIQLLPTSYNQKRTVTLNYEVLLNIYHARRNHRLDEWRDLCDAIEKMPYFSEICLEETT